MKTYQILYAEDVPHYAIGEIKARGPKDALAKARKVDTDTFTALDPDWSNPVCRRIVGDKATGLRFFAAGGLHGDGSVGRIHQNLDVLLRADELS